MTDSRMGETLWPALERLPRGAGVIVRHYDLPLAERRALFARVRRIAARRGLVVLRAGEERLGRGEAGVHGRRVRRTPGIKSWPAHNRRELVAGLRAGADVVFVSPVHATRSHPGARSLGLVRALALARQSRVPVIALGGMNARRGKAAIAAGFHGWAAIDAWIARAG